MIYNCSVAKLEFIDELENIFMQLDVMEGSVTESRTIAKLPTSFGNVDNSTDWLVVAAPKTFKEDQLTWDTPPARLLQ